MEIKIINNQEVWNSWLNKAVQPPFAQSFEWGEILSREGKTIERVAIMDGEEIVAMASIQYHKLPFGYRYAFCPKGPMVKLQVLSSKLQEIINILGEYLKNKNCIFFRFEPDLKFQVSSFKFQVKKISDINPRATAIVDLKKSEEELLKKMHSKTRYNINLAERKGLRVSREKDFSIFIKLMEDTAKRDRFSLHPAEHYEKVLMSPLARQITVYQDEKPLAVGIFFGFRDTFTYLYGASDYQYRQLMAPYLVQWQGIKLGKESGYDFYDLFGIAPRLELTINKEQSAGDIEQYQYDQNHQYAGVTRFKLGFGGEPKEDAGTFDLILKKKEYMIYRLLRKIRRVF